MVLFQHDGKQWEWLEDESITKDIGEFQERPDPDTGEYGQTILYDGGPPKIIIMLTASNVPVDDVKIMRDLALKVGTTDSIQLAAPEPTSMATPKAHQTIIGVVVGFSRRRVDGTGNYEVRLALRRTDLNVLQNEIERLHL